jgi:hypothetical protein
MVEGSIAFRLERLALELEVVDAAALDTAAFEALCECEEEPHPVRKAAIKRINPPHRATVLIDDTRIEPLTAFVDWCVIAPPKLKPVISPPRPC